MVIRLLGNPTGYLWASSDALLWAFIIDGAVLLLGIMPATKGAQVSVRTAVTPAFMGSRSQTPTQLAGNFPTPHIAAKTCVA